MTLEELKELKHPKCFYTKEETDEFNNIYRLIEPEHPDYTYKED